MAGRQLPLSFSAPRLLKKFSLEGTRKEKRQVRLVLFFLFGLTLLAVGLASFYREWPALWKKFNEPRIVVSQQFTLITPSPTPTPRFTREKQQLEEIIKPLRGKYGIYFQELATKDSLAINGKEQFTAASLIKLPVVLTLYREAELGRINLDAIYKLQAKDKWTGAGSLQYKPVGYEITLRKLAELMGKQSDNTAFNIFSRMLRAEKIQSQIEALGMRQTSFSENKTSPEDIGLFFRKLYQEKVVSEKDKEEILSFLTETIWEDRIPAGIPKGIKVAHKIGTEVGVISDAGIVFAEKPFILVILSENVNEIEAKKALPEISKKIYELVIPRVSN